MARAALTNLDTSAIASKNLSRLLSRLDQKLDSGVTTTRIERARIAANLEYARRLLHTLEADSANITVPARRQKSLSELGAQKQTIRRLNERLQLADVPSDDDDDDDDDKDSGDATVVVDTVTAPPPEDDDDYDDYASLKKPERKHTPAAASTPTPVTASTPAATATVDEPVSTLRKRTEKTVGEMRSELFGATATGAKREGHQPSEVAGTEAVLDEQRLEQESITEDLLQMAKLLKESSVTFGASLESEKAYLEAARKGLDRNTSGMQTAGKNIDNLRKNDNVSFLWTMIYLAIIVTLVFLTLFILFFAPKLRWW